MKITYSVLSKLRLGWHERKTSVDNFASYKTDESETAIFVCSVIRVLLKGKKKKTNESKTVGSSYKRGTIIKWGALNNLYDLLRADDVKCFNYFRKIKSKTIPVKVTIQLYPFLNCFSCTRYVHRDL